MSTFTLHLQDATGYRRIDGVGVFVGHDDSGAFAIRARHAPLLTCLAFGLHRYRLGAAGPWTWLALPGAVLRFAGNELTLSTRRLLEDDDYGRIAGRLRDQLAAEERELRGLKADLHHLEEEVLRRLWELGRREGRHG